MPFQFSLLALLVNYLICLLLRRIVVQQALTAAQLVFSDVPKANGTVLADGRDNVKFDRIKIEIENLLLRVQMLVILNDPFLRTFSLVEQFEPLPIGKGENV